MLITKRIRFLFRLAVATLCVASSVVLAQVPADPVRKAPAFEVASIHPHQGPLHTIMDFSAAGPHLRLEGYNLRGLVMEAYRLRNFQVSMPGIDEQQDTYYDIVANAPEGTVPSGDEFRRMMQTLLAERFQLKVHMEKRPMPVYALVVGKGGPKLSPASDEGHALHGVKGRNQFLETDRITMNDLANEIWSGFMPDRPVVDRTGLTGSYKLRLEATPEYRIGRGSAMTSDQGSDLSIFTAVREQLGLRLEPTTAPLDVLVVESVRKPTEN